MSTGEKIVRINIEEEMKSSYIDYSMSVIVSRALPDVRDGLKPVHRRVLFGMSELGMLSNRPYKKSARIVGEVLGKYHPHGDSSVYEAMVRMAQDWSLRYPLIDGQGNFGSVDGDNPAAMRYTEARLNKIAEETLQDLEKETVDFQLNFDDTLYEPTVLPTRIPNLLINGSSGIAVGMATNIAPHNLTEVINATVAYIDNKEIDIRALYEYVLAPDFPTGGIIYGRAGVWEAFETGRGRIVLRAKTEIEVLSGGKENIIVTEIPYQTNKGELIKRIADLVNDKKIEGISNINDESDRQGMRIVIECKKDANSNVILNNLFKLTPLQSSFNVNCIALVDGRPKTLNLKELISHFVDFRHEIVVRRSAFDLAQAEKKAHILEGLLIALDHLDEVINLIRSSQNPDDAKEGLMKNFNLSEAQTKAILELRLQRLTGLERDKIKEEYEEIMKMIAFLKEVLGDEVLRMKIIKDELLEIKEKYGDARKTEIVESAEEFLPQDFYTDEEVVITISHLGYIKRTNLTEFRIQNRGGVGSKASTTRDEDFIEHMFIATNHNTLLLFTQKGKCYWLKVYMIPEGTKASKGRAIQNILQIEPDDVVKAYINVKNLEDPEYINNNYIVLCTRKGVIKKTTLEAFSRPRQNGIIAVNVRENDYLIEAKLTNGNNQIFIAKSEGKAIRFPENKVRPMGRNATGVRGVRLANEETDAVVGMVCVESEEEDILVVSENGYGKRSKVKDYRFTNRGGKGVITINITPKTGNLISLINVSDSDGLMIINKSGLIIRMAVSSLRVQGRATQGVRLINLKEGDSIAAVAKIALQEKDDMNGNNGNNGDTIDIENTNGEKPTDAIENEPFENN